MFTFVLCAVMQKLDNKQAAITAILILSFIVSGFMIAEFNAILLLNF
jgi:hypothetical protein